MKHAERKCLTLIRRHPVRMACLLAVAALAPGCGILGPSESEQEFWARMEALVADHMDAAGSGFGIVVVHDDNIAFARGWGMANIEAGVSFSPDTPTAIASLTKQFTAAAVLILYEREMLTLETAVVSILPELPEEWSDVTVHHLLTHQSGIPNYLDITGDSPEGLDSLTNERVLELVLEDPTLEFPPGTNTNYCNTGYIILANMIEQLTGMSYGDFLRENIFSPLGMNSTFVSDESVDHPSNTARPYDEHNRLYEYSLFTYGDAGIYSTLNDYAKWDRALYTDAIIRQSTLELAFTGYTGGDNDFGYGWMVGRHSGSKSLRHGGFLTGILNYVFRVPEKRFTYLFLSNGGVFANGGFGTWTDELKDEIFDYYL